MKLPDWLLAAICTAALGLGSWGLLTANEANTASRINATKLERVVDLGDSMKRLTEEVTKLRIELARLQGSAP